MNIVRLGFYSYMATNCAEIFSSKIVIYRFGDAKSRYSIKVGWLGWVGWVKWAGLCGYGCYKWDCSQSSGRG